MRPTFRDYVHLSPFINRMKQSAGMIEIAAYPQLLFTRAIIEPFTE